MYHDLVVAIAETALHLKEDMLQPRSKFPGEPIMLGRCELQVSASIVALGALLC